MAYSANGNDFPDINIGRVKYDMEYDSDNDLYRLPKAPELIIACENAAVGVFYTTASDYEPVWFDSSALSGTYGDQIFFDVANNKNLVVLSEAISDPCLTTMKEFVNATGVTGLLDFDGIDDRVTLSGVDVTGSKTISFKAYLLYDESEDSFIPLILKNSDTDYFYISVGYGSVFIVASNEGVSYSHSFLSDISEQILDIEVVKTTGTISSITINGEVLLLTELSSTELEMTGDYIGFYINQNDVDEFAYKSLLWDLEINGTLLSGQPNGNTDAAWTNGGITGTVEGNPTTTDITV